MHMQPDIALLSAGVSQKGKRKLDAECEESVRRECTMAHYTQQ